MSEALRRIKRATVALVLLHEEREGQPFTIVGSGFCIDPRGAIVTSEHVLSAFMKKPLMKAYADAKRGEWDEPRHVEIEAVTPHVMFFLTEGMGVELVCPLVRPMTAMAKTSHDIGLIRLYPHTSFPDGFPYVPIAKYSDLIEGGEIGVCGFPLGNYLYKQVGVVASSFSKGVLSSVIPTAGVQAEYLKGFQLNVFATHGSSGGPVFQYDSGRVFGAIESNVVGPDGQPIHGLVKAAPIYPLLEHDSMERMMRLAPGQTPVA